MIISGSSRHRPRWYRNRQLQRFRDHATAHPGLHRLVIVMKLDDGTPLEPVIEHPACIAEEAEPELRRIAGRFMRLDPQVPDDDPYTLL